MDYKEYLLSELERGFSKSDLERIIGLPKNNLSAVLNSDRPLSKKSILKIEKFMALPKLDPLDYLVKRADKKKDGDNRDNQFQNAARGRDKNGINNDEIEKPKKSFADLKAEMDKTEIPRLKGESSIDYRLRMIEENKK